MLGYEEMNMKAAIRKLKPDVIALGYDQRDILEAVNDALQEYMGEVKVIQTKRYGKRDLNSSSKIKNKIIEELKL